jgi:hypothetical protein
MKNIKIKNNYFIVADWKKHFFFDFLPTLCFTRSKYYNHTDYGIFIAFLIFDWGLQIELKK